jgi:hypothetical protein
MTPDAFRRMALGMTGAEERSHMNHPDFRVGRKIFATIYTDGKQGMVSLTPEQQAGFLRDYPGMFVPAAGAWGRRGATMVQFAKADPEVVGEAMTLAWQNVTRIDATRNTTRTTARRRRPGRMAGAHT